MSFGFFLLSAGLGVGLAVDAFSVSLANGLNEPCMKRSKALTIAGIFAVFQGVMPLIGWLLVHTLLVYFTAFEKAIPWIALALLSFIGIKMIIDGAKCNGGEACKCGGVSFANLLVQGVATSIDALSVGFTIASYNIGLALISVSIIAIITFLLCFIGVYVGKTFGTKLSGKASLLGGIILIAIGLEIFITGII
ncbi:MAG: manganese efflux pump [Clostridia bacterium]|nr:manganese efflux pump [Clostridia bacterium]